jgi:hypothetical protein
VTVAFWTNWFQTQLNRHATDILFRTSQRAVYSRPSFTVSLAAGRQLPSSQFTVRRAIVSLIHGRRASLFSLKRSLANQQF